MGPPPKQAQSKPLEKLSFKSVRSMSGLHKECHWIFEKQKINSSLKHI